MYKVKLRKNNKEKRKLRIRGKISGTASVPRVSVFRSNKYIYGQLIDDVKGETLITSDSEVKKVHKGKTKTEAAHEMGKILAEKALEKKIKKVVYDRKGYRYHGRVKSFAEGLREGGLVL